MVLRWNGAMVFVLFYKWRNGPMVNLFWSQTEIWRKNDMVKLSNGEYIFGAHLHWWWNGEMAKKINGKMNLWWDLTVGWVIISALVSLTFIHPANDGDTDDYGAAHLYYLWILLVSLLLCLLNFMSSLMYRLCNDDMITDGAEMTVQ